MDEQPFRDAIGATPSDDAPLLIYADWIEERGESDRAAVLRQFVARGLPRDELGLHRLFTYLDEPGPFGPIPFERADNSLMPVPSPSLPSSSRLSAFSLISRFMRARVSPLQPRPDRLPAGTSARETSASSAEMVFVWCPPTDANGFAMGDVEGKWDDNPVTVVLASGFWMGRTEVTQAQWQSVMGTTFRQQCDKVSNSLPVGDGDDYPMYYVNYEEAIEFARKLTEAEQEVGRLPSDWVYRLPTEAQWEYACRAGTTGPYSFVGGFDQLGNYAWFRDNSDGRTHPVGGKEPNAWGLYDMHGNVWEWCLDSYQESIFVNIVPRVALQANSSRVLRGGCYYSSGWDCRSAYRIGNDPAYRHQFYGFRLARVPRS